MLIIYCYASCTILQWYIAVFFLWTFFFLIMQHFQALNQFNTCLSWINNVVNHTEPCRNIVVGKPRPVHINFFLARFLWIFTFCYFFANMILTAPSGPITAI